MNMPAIAKVRIPILVALAVSESVGIVHFYGQPRFERLVAISLAGILLIMPLLWIDWLKRRGVTYFPFFMLALAFLSVANAWLDHELALVSIWGFLLLSFVVLILVKIARPANLAQQAANVASIREDGQQTGPVSRNLFGLIVWFGIVATIWSVAKTPISLQIAAPLALVGLWFVWRLTVNLHRFFKQEAAEDRNGSNELGN